MGTKAIGTMGTQTATRTANKPLDLIRRNFQAVFDGFTRIIRQVRGGHDNLAMAAGAVNPDSTP